MSYLMYYKECNVYNSGMGCDEVCDKFVTQLGLHLHLMLSSLILCSWSQWELFVKNVNSSYSFLSSCVDCKELGNMS
jgi:hypothetical protein